MELLFEFRGKRIDVFRLSWAERGVRLYGKSDYYLIFTKNLVRNFRVVTLFWLLRRHVVRLMRNLSRWEDWLLRKRVVRPVSILSRWEFCWELFLGALGIRCRAHRLLVQPIVGNLLREVGQPRDQWAEKGHTSLGVIVAWGMRDYGPVATMGT